MSDEPNSKQIARSGYRKSKHVDRNTSQGQHRKDERKKKALEARENELQSRIVHDDQEIVDFDSSRSKYSKRILAQRKNDIAELDIYSNQQSILNMQELLNSKIDFIPKFDMMSVDGDDEENDVNSSSVKNKSNSNSNEYTINVGEIEKLLLSISIPQRLDINVKYFDGIDIPQPNNTGNIKRKINKNIVSKSSKSSSSKATQEENKTISTPTSSAPPAVPVTSAPPTAPTTSDNLEDWLDTII
ncbi:hypothetical protein CYY_007555 [Polysphondylium violaceum]|uniref:Uncharacterized protein n=1 Tax=Polysphondylium violaceum TaxID=133409 RepID=A0A8J4PX30_9MYCE|nr:hypothetical protein CYY_007555 [Polysphondylium violaceum]